MPTFNIFKGFGSSKAQPLQRRPILEQDFAYSARPHPLSVSSASSQSRYGSMPPEIIKSQPIIDPSSRRRGTLRKKNRHHHYLSEDISPAQLGESQYDPQDDIVPGPPPVMHDQVSGFQANSSPFHAGGHSYAHEDYHHPQSPYVTGPPGRGPVVGEAYDGDLLLRPEPLSPHGAHGGTYPEIHDGRHHAESHHRHRHHHSHSPHQYDSYAAPPVHGQYGHGHRDSHSRSRSFTSIPSVYREPDSGDLDMYADQGDGNDYVRGGTRNRRSRDRYEDEYSEGHGHGPHMQTQARIGWIPDSMHHEVDAEPRTHEPEPGFVDDSGPQIIPGPIASDNPFSRNVHHTREPEYIPDHRHRHRHRHRSTSGEFAHGTPHRGQDTSADPRVKTYMYKDHHHSETIEPRMHERYPSYHGEGDSDPEEYRYIVPKGVSVIFRDHDGNPIARIGHPGSTSGGRQKDMVPFTVQDEYGNILYRHEGDHYRDDRYLRSGAPSRPRTAKVIMIDKHGNQVPLKTDESISSRSHHSQPSHRSHRSDHSQHPHSQHSHSQHSQSQHSHSHHSHSHHSHSSSSSHPHNSGRRRAYH